MNKFSQLGGGQRDTAAEGFAKIVGFLFAALFTPMVWRHTAPYVGEIAAKLWATPEAAVPFSLLWGVVVFISLYAVSKATTLFIYAAIVMLIARFAIMAA
ncbi:MAG: hypothetical protein AAFW68_13980 [Pseudomonadota bacterium]